MKNIRTIDGVMLVDMKHKGLVAPKSLIKTVMRLDEPDFLYLLRLGFISSFQGDYYWVPKQRREEIGRIQRGGLYEN